MVNKISEDVPDTAGDIMSDEQRSFVRLPVDFDVELSVSNNKRSSHETFRKFSGRAVNISDEGLYIRVEELEKDIYDRLISGDLNLNLEFKLTVPLKTVDTAGEIVWAEKESSKQKGLGVRLTNIGKENQDKIVHYILNQIVKSNLNA